MSNNYDEKSIKNLKDYMSILQSQIDSICGTEKPKIKKPRKKMDPDDIRTEVVSFKITPRELRIVKSKFTSKHDKVGVIARQYLIEQTDFFKELTNHT